MIKKKTTISVTRSTEKILCEACSAVTAMINSFMIVPDEWPLMQLESPEIWKRIEEIEWCGPRTIEESRSDMHALLKNYERLFTRRITRREKAA